MSHSASVAGRSGAGRGSNAPLGRRRDSTDREAAGGKLRRAEDAATVGPPAAILVAGFALSPTASRISFVVPSLCSAPAQGTQLLTVPDALFPQRPGNWDLPECLCLLGTLPDAGAQATRSRPPSLVL